MRSRAHLYSQRLKWQTRHPVRSRLCARAGVLVDHSTISPLGHWFRDDRVADARLLAAHYVESTPGGSARRWRTTREHLAGASDVRRGEVRADARPVRGKDESNMTTTPLDVAPNLRDELRVAQAAQRAYALSTSACYLEVLDFIRSRARNQGRFLLRLSDTGEAALLTLCDTVLKLNDRCSTSSASAQDK